MSKYEKLLDRLLSGTSDANFSFLDIRHLLKRIGFEERIKGGHHIFAMTGLEEIVNIQPKGNKAKPYQIKQIRGIVVKYKLKMIGGT